MGHDPGPERDIQIVGHGRCLLSHRLPVFVGVPHCLILFAKTYPD